MEKLADIQKLRALAVLMVLFGHTSLPLADFLLHGYTGVSLFFVISGYVVTLTFLSSFPSTASIFDRRIAIHLRDFFVRRFFRILPVAVGWIILSFLIGQMINYAGGSYGDLAKWVKEFKWFFSGFYNYYFAEARAPALFGQYWSLAVEMQFYCVLPFLLVLFRTTKQRVRLCIVAMIAVSTWLRMEAAPDLIGMLTHTQADSLFAGVLLCIVFRRGKDEPSDKTLETAFEVPQPMKHAISGGLLIILFILPSYLDGVVHASIKYPIFTALSTVIVYLGQRNDGWILGGMPLVDKVLGFIGDRSYSIYVSHVVLYSGVFVTLRAKAPELFPPWLQTTDLGLTIQVVYMFAGAILLSDLSYRFIEVPYLTYGKNLINSWRAASVKQAMGSTPSPSLTGTKSRDPQGDADQTNGSVEIAVSGVSVRCEVGADVSYVASLVRAIRVNGSQTSGPV